jgi:N6-L-threonylcarbamoyladenine synthase
MSTAGALSVLGIETSCDETAAAVVVREGAGRGRIVSNVVRAQWEQHRPYGGVVPELASRAHVECLDEIIAQALSEAGMHLRDLDGIAVTAGPGLIGGLMVGVITAETLAQVCGLPLVAINHLEAHALTVGLTEGVTPPYLLLLVSGGHTQLLVVRDVGAYVRLGSTIDDALGEAFDKTAKLLGLGAPGGPAVERAAASGTPGRFDLPRPMFGRPEPNFSFSGLKNAVRLAAVAAAPLSAQDVADLCADFQAAAAASVENRVETAMALAEAMLGEGAPRRLVVAGGVAANQALKSRLTALAAGRGYALHVPPVALCGDNGAMIAWAGAERLARDWASPPGIVARARWPLDATATAVLGAGRLGAKA